MRTLVTLIALGALSGCLALELELTPKKRGFANDPALVSGLDCVPILLGIGIGTADVDAAARRAAIGEIRQVSLRYAHVLGLFGGGLRARQRGILSRAGRGAQERAEGRGRTQRGIRDKARRFLTIT